MSKGSTLCTQKCDSDPLEYPTRIISANQTAYLKGRLISDNLELVALANKLAKDNKRLNRLLIALDAKKAFYSVRHPFIREVNDKIGMGYQISKGVKRGDALMCIHFCNGTTHA